MTKFEELTKSPKVLAIFLRALPVLEAPWDTEFQKKFCAECAATDCDTCPNEEYRNNPDWWLAQETEETK